jgi:Zn-dependent protease
LSEIVLPLLAAIAAIVLHEVAHGYAALALGDDTARRAGRLTLNPIAHVDRVGTLLVPGLLLILQYFTGSRFMFGWAKPVPVDPWRFRDPRRGMMLVAMAGPAINFALAAATALALHLDDDPLATIGTMMGLAGAERGVAMLYAVEFAISFILFNILLGLFNLLPIPPLDGGRIVVGILPLRMAMAWAKLERAGIFIVLALLFLLPMLLRDLGIPFDPVRLFLVDGAGWMLGHLPLPEPYHRLLPHVL